mmetsp:Transcript_7109/g.13494  ORF Transcript_7109/g.13494 Transcript_7109/m.13494 type:complete len:545 (-) Transcript_7109:239-1873(-)|eukprot:CAMPEP_0114244956 /NCGR_PEP_ID=MMETSP0058-20121206/11624_1 /TAXON_ID=36894 /ORGANISM="Pyramimonas parkeae, CCMP726" /LENGTH=544 /DNA_ID=CAMNT_0001357947 /DNA_START=55 /DNA_END=1689 /DNA_ORIENTATION=+
MRVLARQLVALGLYLFTGIDTVVVEAIPAHPFRTGIYKSQDQDEVHLELSYQVDEEIPTEQWFEQPLDKFENLRNHKTFKQRYFVNDTFFDGSGPVFLCVGGEGPGFKASVVVTGQVHCALMMTLAAKHNALVFALEHRYYGRSVPTPDYSTANLKWLSSEQALADLASFVGGMRLKFNLTSANRWVTWGGSYPGMLTAWARLKYPHLVYAAISSSAPVKAIANFQGYNDVVASSLSKEIVGGSKECLMAVQQAFADMGALMSSPRGRRVLETKFGVCNKDSHPLESQDNRMKFSEVTADSFPLQENDQACSSPGCNIEKVCKVMLNQSLGEALERLAALNERWLEGSCLDASYANDVKAITDTSLERGGGRVWFYQTCTEFGFYQTCDPDSKCPFMSTPWLDTLQSYYHLCTIAYNISAQQVDSVVSRTNVRYGGDTPAGSRILFANGDIDPWHAASVLESLPGEPVLYVQGASHHQWTHPPRTTDSPELLQARNEIAKRLASWLDNDLEMGTDGIHSFEEQKRLQGLRTKASKNRRELQNSQ